MEYLLICSVALIASGLTLFSGFGLGTLLMPVFAIFFPVHTAIAMTAVVHLLNNLFKLVLIGKHASKTVVLRFGLPALPAALAGAVVLTWLSEQGPLATYHLGGLACEVTTAKLLIALLMTIFSGWEVLPTLRRISFGERALPIGGFLSGFFGGFSGHQGALRSAFLLKCGLSKEAFIATGVAIACIVDVGRLFVYGTKFTQAGFQGSGFLLFAAVTSAFVGAFVGVRLMTRLRLTLSKRSATGLSTSTRRCCLISLERRRTNKPMKAASVSQAVQLTS